MRYGDEGRLESDRRQWIVASFMHVMRSLKSSAAGRFSASESLQDSGTKLVKLRQETTESSG
jgi:hypothetical protein